MDEHWIGMDQLLKKKEVVKSGEGGDTDGIKKHRMMIDLGV